MDFDLLSKVNEDRKDPEENAAEIDNDISEEGKAEEARKDEDKNEVNDDDEDDERVRRINNDDEDDERAGRTRDAAKKNKFAMMFRDVDDTIRSFNGNEKYPVDQWIEDFEETAELFGLTEMHRMIFAKKLLRELAKLFIQGERGLYTWKKLKRVLKNKFSDEVNRAELHR